MKKAIVIVLLALMVGCSKDPKVQRDKYFVSAQKYLDAKKYEDASIEFRNAIRLDKGHIPSYLGIAKAFQQMGNHQDAIATYQEVLKLDGKNVKAKLSLGEYLITGGINESRLFKQAQLVAEDALKIEPENGEALILLGNAYSGQNDIDKALPLYEKALSLDPNNLKAMLNLAAVQLRKKDMPLAEATFKKALLLHANDIQSHLAIAAFYSVTQRPLEAEAYLKKAFDLAPADSRCLYSLANFYLSTKRIVEAENVYKEAMARKPREREPRWGMAGFYLQQGKVDTGIEVLNELLKINKNDRPALLRLAEIYMSRNDDANAEKSIQTVLAANKNDGTAHFLSGKILRRRREYDKAMTEFDTAIKLDVSLAPAYLEKANLQLVRGDLEACEATLRETLQRNRNYLPARAANAKLLAMRQRPQESLQQAQEVLAVLPNDENALGARAEAFRILGKLADSRKDWIRLCEIQPKSSDYQYRLGVVEVMIGNKSAAMSAFRKALELRPDFSAAINDMLYLQMQDKKFDAAFAELDRLGKSSSPQDEICKFRGRVYLAKKDTIAAEVEFKKAIQINPKNYQIYILLAQLSLQRNNLPQAIKEVDQAIAGNDKFSPAYLQKAYYLERSKDISGAIANYRKALALDSNNGVAANNLAWLLCEGSSNLQEALSLSQAARKRLPEEPEIAETLGWTYYKMKNYTLAVDQLLFSVNNRKQPSAENYYRLGMALYAKGDIYHAKQTLAKSLDINAKFPGAEEARRILKLPS
jgi:Tfp pilus assembly protein PilF